MEFAANIHDEIYINRIIIISNFSRKSDFARRKKIFTFEFFIAKRPCIWTLLRNFYGLMTWEDARMSALVWWLATFNCRDTRVPCRVEDFSPVMVDSRGVTPGHSEHSRPSSFRLHRLHRAGFWYRSFQFAIAIVPTNPDLWIAGVFELKLGKQKTQ